MLKRILISLLIILPAIITLAQDGTVRGSVCDRLTGQPIPYVAIALLDPDHSFSILSDSIGQFAIPAVPIGRYDLKANCLGYYPLVLKEQMVGAAKELIVEIELEPSSTALDELVVQPHLNKATALNPMAISSGRMLSVEEASRYAGGFDDPSRLVSSFAGVAQNIGNNGLSVQGNAPKFMQWRLEDVEIPNPNHFAEVTSFGGGGITALSANVLGNSDFFSGAFPAQYGNALSGVFDIKMRRGNTERHEHSIGVGVIGIDLSSEGPFCHGYNGSYVFNYRYSTLSWISSLLPADADGTKYQDLSFNIHLPTAGVGAFSLWGIGLIDRSGTTPEEDRSKWEYEQDWQDQDVKQYMVAVGLKHRIGAGKEASLNSTIAATVQGLDMRTSHLDRSDILLPKNRIRITNWNFIAATNWHKRFSGAHDFRAGAQWTGMRYDMLLRDAKTQLGILETVSDRSGMTSLLSAYATSLVRLSSRYSATIGLHGQWFLLNGKATIEPRVALKWQFKPNQFLSVNYGMHSRLEMLQYYFVKDETGRLPNKDLDFTKAHHVSIGYDLTLGTNRHLRIEPYLQWLYNVPVIPDSTFSMINLQGGDDWFIADRLVNKGRGINYGIDLTFEQYMTHGFYYMFSASVFNARFRTAEDQWFDSRYNRQFIFNALAGKEWMVGKAQRNVLGINGKVALQGGDRYSPIDQAASDAALDAVYDETRPFSCQLSPALFVHFTISYTINRRHLSHEFALKFINLTAYRDYYGHRYNHATYTVEAEREANMIPNICYRLSF